ncbi:hypothetical protein GALMADRAFT_1264724 [Galerina marginata CBS 339.88]|uniref:Uncharacterized protein n=1 Tax=Galerina marginata (strain CBS 339.88) TaxID=685588 RepID=A0A067T8M2_GALM3|nr:hypothetical protein GALMADRAFT_1264724 [Galerina marginata CBS 339.88]
MNIPRPHRRKHRGFGWSSAIISVMAHSAIVDRWPISQTSRKVRGEIGEVEFFPMAGSGIDVKAKCNIYYAKFVRIDTRTKIKS